MARQLGVSVINDFKNGLITETSPLQFPESAATETDNCIFGHTGKVSRRLGFDFEEASDPFAIDVNNLAKTDHVWKNVALEGDLSFVVVQLGDELHFYRVSSSSLSSGKHSQTIDLTDYIPSGSPLTSVATMECQFSSGNGILIVTHPKLDTFAVTYDLGTDLFTDTVVTITVRDFEGDLTDSLAVDDRPAVTEGAMSAAHRYNLRNQGWTTANLAAWDTARSDMPSNSDVPWYFKDASDEFDFTIVDDRSVGNSIAPKGHFIYSLYNTNRSTNVSGAANASITNDRVSTSAFFAGRIFYTGLNVQEYGSKIFFTQIIERPDQYGKCYQANDPTSELVSDLLPSDGGFIDLHEAGNIVKLVPLLNALIVFATNGVWSITGSQGIGFTANDYTRVKLSDVANISHRTFVTTEDTLFWWTHTGIYTITRDPQTNNLIVKNIARDTIKSFFDEIPLESREHARGAYNPTENIIQWVYSSTPNAGFTVKYEFDRMLTLDLVTGAFYPWSVDKTTHKIHGIIAISGSGGSFIEDPVTADADPVEVNGDPVIVFASQSSSIDTVVKYLVSYDGDITWAEAFRDTYLDWQTYDYSSYFITGYKIRGEALRKHQTSYLRLYTDNDVPSVFNVQAIWDYAIDRARGRFSSVQQVVQNVTMNDPTNYGVRTKRLKIRGHGLVSQLMFSSVEGQPFDIVGWTSLDSVNERP